MSCGYGSRHLGSYEQKQIAVTCKSGSPLGRGSDDSSKWMEVQNEYIARGLGLNEGCAPSDDIIDIIAHVVVRA